MRDPETTVLKFSTCTNCVVINALFQAFGVVITSEAAMAGTDGSTLHSSRNVKWHHQEWKHSLAISCKHAFTCRPSNCTLGIKKIFWWTAQTGRLIKRVQKINPFTFSFQPMLSQEIHMRQNKGNLTAFPSPQLLSLPLAKPVSGAFPDIPAGMWAGMGASPKDPNVIDTWRGKTWPSNALFPIWREHSKLA